MSDVAQEGVTHARSFPFSRDIPDPLLGMVLQADNQEWLNPKGSLEPGDAILDRAVIEVVQETGVNPNNLAIVPNWVEIVQWTSSYDGSNKAAAMHLMHYVGDMSGPFTPHDLSEILEVRWVPQSMRFNPGLMNRELPSIIAMEGVYNLALIAIRAVFAGRKSSLWVRDVVDLGKLGLTDASR